MSNVTQSILDVLQELRLASINDQELAMKKYDMLFLGSNFNQINSIELRHSLEKVFDLKISLSELHALLPQLCQTLKMKCEPMRAVDDLSNPVPAAYFITLYE